MAAMMAGAATRDQRTAADGTLAFGAIVDKVVTRCVPCTSAGEEMRPENHVNAPGLLPTLGGFQDFSHIKVQLVMCKVRETHFVADTSDSVTVLVRVRPKVHKLQHVWLHKNGERYPADDDGFFLLPRADVCCPTRVALTFEYTSPNGPTPTYGPVTMSDQWFVETMVPLSFAAVTSKHCTLM